MESLTEAKRIAAICRRMESSARVAIRINPAGEAEGGPCAWAVARAIWHG